MTKLVGITEGAFSESFLKICHMLNAETVVLGRDYVVKDDNMEDIIESLDLILFPGGADIHPNIYNQSNLASFISEQSVKRDLFELDILEIVNKLSKKILAVCRGHQLVNAALGGNLVQEIGWMGNHSSYHDLEETEGLVGSFFKKVNSMHHQGVLTAGVGQTVTSKHGGVIESTESENIITVQFHPECMNDLQSANFFQYILQEWI